jgi:hypothetical protein
MIHTCSPLAWFPAERLEQPANCVECGATGILAEGVVHRGHYTHRNQDGTGEERETFLWLCSHKCFLGFEHQKFMGRA